MLNIDDRFLGEATIDQFWFMCHLAKFMNMDATCFPSNQTLCDCTGWRISKLNEVKKSCIDAGFIKVETRYLNNRQSSNEYTVLIDRISIAVNLKGKKARQIPATFVAPCHAGGTPPATLAAPPPATLAVSEVLTNKEVLTRERESARAQTEISADLKTEIQQTPPPPIPPAPSPAPRGWQPVDPTDEIEIMRADDLCKERFVRVERLPLERYGTMLDNFLLKVRSEQHSHNNRRDFRNHFFSWARLTGGHTGQANTAGQPVNPVRPGGIPKNVPVYGS